MLRITWVLALALTGCNGIKDILGGDDDQGGNSGSGVDVPARTADETELGDLSDGQVLSNLDFAHDSAIACWPETEDLNLDGAHRFFEVDKQGSDDVFVRATPDSGVDVSLYTLEFSGDYQTPPDVTAATRCEAAYDAATDSNPGDAETIELQGYGDRALLVGVAGAGGATTGGFQVEVWKEAANVGDDTGS